MPIFKLFLTNPELRLHIEKDSESCSFWFDAKIQPPGGRLETFKIFCGGEQYDGYSMKGAAIIRQRDLKNESQQSPPPDPNNTFGSEEKPDCLCIAWSPPDSKDSDKFPPFFDLYISLPVDTFSRVLQANPETRLIYLWVDTGIGKFQEEGLVYGNDPGGNEIEWRVEKKNYAHVKSVTFKIKPRPEDTLRPEPSPKANP